MGDRSVSALPTARRLLPRYEKLNYERRPLVLEEEQAAKATASAMTIKKWCAIYPTLEVQKKGETR